jgi:predicted metalloprotease
MRRTTLAAALLTVCASVLAAGCTTTLQGKPVSVFDDPFSVAGMRASEGPSGLRSDAEKPSREVTGTDGGPSDELAASAVSDIEDFWGGGAFEETFDKQFRPVPELISWDANGFDGTFCGDDTYGLVNAGYCDEDRTIGWDRGELVPQLRKANGDMGVAMVLAHEYGHSVQYQSKLIDDKTETLVAEQQADCFAGAYMRWVAEGNSPRFTLSTGDGLNNVLAAVIAFRDPVLAENDDEAGVDEHGSAFERLSAFQFGFTDGPKACTAIDLKEIDQRRGELPVLLPEDESGELPVTEESVRSIVDAMGILFSPAQAPALSFDTGAGCTDARVGGPASYCPSTNTIVVDLPAMETLGTPEEDVEGGGLASGDNTAYSVLVSRYTQALQREHGGVALDNAEAALRTACLTGVATAKMSKDVTTPDGNTIALPAGDLDEAVSGILVNGLAASDVNGDSVPAGFSRIDAFRIGVLGDADRCFKRFP